MAFEIILIIIISVLVAGTTFNLMTIMAQRKAMHRARKMIEKMILNDDIVESSKWTLMTKYHISEERFDQFLEGGANESTDIHE